MTKRRRPTGGGESRRHPTVRCALAETPANTAACFTLCDDLARLALERYLRELDTDSHLREVLD